MGGPGRTPGARLIGAAVLQLSLLAIAAGTAWGQGGSTPAGQGGGAPVCRPNQACTAAVAPPGGGGDATPPTITFSPGAGVYYSGPRAVTIGWCDNASLNSSSRQVHLDGTLVSTSFTGTTNAACPGGTYGYSQVNVNQQMGVDTLSAKICDQSANCTTRTAVYTYAGADVTAPTVQITPGSQASASNPTNPVITLCDDRDLVGFHVDLNGTNVTSSFSWQLQAGTPGSGCATKATSTGALQLARGANTVTAQVQDSAGNRGSQTVTYTYAATLDVTPTNQTSTAPGMFDAGLSYATAAYRSLDADRAVTLVYSSFTARPTATVQVDVTDNSIDPAPRTSLSLIWQNARQTLPDGRTELHYATGRGTNRLVGLWSAAGTATGGLEMTALVRRYHANGQTEELTAPVRIVVLNEGNSPFGAGWTIAGVERIYSREGGVLVAHGDGTSTFYPSPAVCNAPAEPCYYGHSPGDFSTFSWDGSRGFYIRRSRDGVTSYFTGDGRLVSVVDRLNNAQYYAYDANGRLSTITDPAGKVTTFGYDGAGKLATITDPAGRITRTVVNAAGDLVSITDPDGVAAMQLTYHANHRLQRYVDRGGRQTDVTYDAFGKLASLEGPAFTAEGGQSFRLKSTLLSVQQAAIGSLSAGTPTAPLPRIDPATFRAAITDPQGRTTRLALDPWGIPTRVEDPLGYVSTSVRNSEGQLVYTADAGGNTTTYTWNGEDLRRVSSPAGTVEMSYNSAGQVEWTTGATPTEENVYNATTGLLERTVVAGTDTSAYTYDTRGRVRTITDPEHHVTTYDYNDPSGWMNTRSVTSGGRSSTFRYDGYGRLVGTSGPDGRETVMQFDSVNRLRAVTTPDQGTTRYGWGPLFLDSVTDARGQVYRWTRNALGQVEREVRPGDAAGVNRTAEYDRYARTIAATNRLGQRVSVTYDAQDRVRTRTSAEGQTTTFAFSPDTPLDPSAPGWVAVSNAESTDTLRVDSRGRVSGAVMVRPLGSLTPQRYEVQPRYDGMDRAVGLVVLQPGGVRDSIGYRYDPATFRPVTMRDLSGGTTWFYSTREGLPEKVTLPNGVNATQSYTSTHMLDRITYDNLAVNNAAGVDYAYDLLNRIQSRANPSHSRHREYTYDPAGGWLSAFSDYQQTGSSRPMCQGDADAGIVCSDPAATLTYTGGDAFSYDLTGNPTDHGAVLGAANRLSQFNGYTLGYDGEGNLISKTKPGFTQTFAWNSLGQLESVTTNGLTVSYGYDGMGQRVRRSVNGNATGYVYAGGSLLLEYDPSGVQAKYTYYPGEDRPHSVVRGGQTYYYATDGQGSVQALFNSSNAIVNQYTYLPFGEPQTATETVANRIRYVGREYEVETGLYYNNARWYDPQLHRFVSEDPIGIAGGINLYAYTGNDPVNYTDPTGLYRAPDCQSYYEAQGYSRFRAREICWKGSSFLLPTMIVTRRATPRPAPPTGPDPAELSRLFISTPVTPIFKPGGDQSGPGRRYQEAERERHRQRNLARALARDSYLELERSLHERPACQEAERRAVWQGVADGVTVASLGVGLWVSTSARAAPLARGAVGAIWATEAKDRWGNVADSPGFQWGYFIPIYATYLAGEHANAICHAPLAGQ